MARGDSTEPARFDERAFHAWLARTAARRDGPLRALADDVAYLPVPEGAVLVTTDAFVEGLHFVPGAPPAQVGAALVEANLSDLASKGARPVGFLLDLLLPPSTPGSWARRAVRGVRRALRAHGCDLVGGDTKPSPRRILVGTAVGRAPRGALPARHRARPGDVVVVTGRMGRAGLTGRAARTGAPAADRSALALRARVREGVRLAQFTRAMVDTSDGAFESAHLIAEASGVALDLDEGSFPLPPPLRRMRDRDRRVAIVGYGGDYELLATMDPRRVPAARRALGPSRCPLTVIGRVRRGRGAFLLREGRREPLPRAGWNPFRPRPPPH